MKDNFRKSVILVYSYPMDTCSVCRDNLFGQVETVLPNVVIVPIQPN